MDFNFEIYSVDNLSLLKEDWNVLHENSVNPSFYNQYSYIYQSIQAFKNNGASPFVVAVKKNLNLIGVFYFQSYLDKTDMVALKAIQFTALEEIDKPYPVIHSKYHDEAWLGLFEFLKAQDDWDVIRLIEQVPANVSVIEKALEKSLFRYRVNSDKSGPIISLTQAWPEFLSQHKKTRKKISSFEKYSSGNHEFKLEFGGTLFSEYLKVERNSWKYGKLGIQKNTDTETFYSSLLKNINADEVAVGILYLEGNPISAELVYIKNDILYLVQGCYDQRFSNYSPGMISTAYVLRHFFGVDSVKWADGLCGYADYLNSWSSLKLNTTRIDIYNLNTRVGAFFIVRLLRKVFLMLMPEKFKRYE